MAKKILFINQEIAPFVPNSELSDMGRELPQHMLEEGWDIRTFMPKWGNINERRGQLHEVIRLSGLNLAIDDTDHTLIIKVASIPTSRIQVYFIDNEEFFAKHHAGDDEHQYDDDELNGERAIFFARGVLETVKKLRWQPDVIMCQGWITQVIPLYLKTAYKDEVAFSNAKVVSALFGDHLKTPFGKRFKKIVAFKSAKQKLMDKYNDNFNEVELGKLATDYSDAVIEAADNVDSGLISYIKESGKPMLTLKNRDFSEFSDFFNKL